MSMNLVLVATKRQGHKLPDLMEKFTLIQTPTSVTMDCFNGNVIKLDTDGIPTSYKSFIEKLSTSLRNESEMSFYATHLEDLSSWLKEKSDEDYLIHWSMQ